MSLGKMIYLKYSNKKKSPKKTVTNPVVQPVTPITPVTPVTPPTTPVLTNTVQSKTDTILSKPYRLRGFFSKQAETSRKTLLGQ